MRGARRAQIPQAISEISIDSCRLSGRPWDELMVEVNAIWKSQKKTIGSHLPNPIGFSRFSSDIGRNSSYTRHPIEQVAEREICNEARIWCSEPARERAEIPGRGLEASIWKESS